MPEQKVSAPTFEPERRELWFSLWERLCHLLRFPRVSRNRRSSCRMEENRAAT